MDKLEKVLKAKSKRHKIKVNQIKHVIAHVS